MLAKVYFTFLEREAERRALLIGLASKWEPLEFRVLLSGSQLAKIVEARHSASKDNLGAEARPTVSDLCSELVLDLNCS